jgi:hypothetical protein
MESENKDSLYGLYSIRKEALEKNLAITTFALINQFIAIFTKGELDFNSQSIVDELEDNRTIYFKEFTSLKREKPKDDFETIMFGLSTMDLVIKVIDKKSEK